MKCNTLDLVECLRSMNNEPIAFASSGTRDPKMVIDGKTSDFFITGYESKDPYWGIDFKGKVTIQSYQVFTGSWCYYLSKWTFYTSMDNKTWKPVDSQEGYPVDKTYQLNSQVSARYAKIEGRANGCSNPTQFAISEVKFFGIVGNKNNRRSATCNNQKAFRSSYYAFSLMIKLVILLPNC